MFAVSALAEDHQRSVYITMSAGWLDTFLWASTSYLVSSLHGLKNNRWLMYLTVYTR